MMNEAVFLNEGRSAYEIWLAQGHVGTEADFLEAMRGNSGYSGDISELELVNNLTDGGSTAALSAEMGKQLQKTKASKDLDNLSEAGQDVLNAKANTKGTYEDFVAGDLVSLNDRVVTSDKFVVRPTAGDESIDSSADALLLQLLGGCGDEESEAFKIYSMLWHGANQLDPTAWASGKTRGYITGEVAQGAIASGQHKLCIIHCPKCEAGEYGTAEKNNGYLLTGPSGTNLKVGDGTIIGVWYSETLPAVGTEVTAVTEHTFTGHTEKFYLPEEGYMIIASPMLTALRIMG